MRQKSKKFESSTLGIIIAAVCIVIYLAALIQAAVRLYFSVEQHKVTAELEFDRISGSALTAGTYGFMSDSFISTVNSALASSKSIEALIISGPDGEYAFERQRGRAVTWVNNSPRFNNGFGISSHTYYKPLPIGDLRNVNIQAKASSFDNTEITKILKETIFFILIGFSLAFFTLLIQALLSSAKFASKEPNKQADFESQKKEAPVAVQAKQPSAQKAAQNAVPKGLYSQRSNIGWEEYLLDRLNSELHRCSSSEKDLTLFTIEFFSGISDQQYRYAAEETVSVFPSRDLLFEKGKNGITVIDPGVNLETGLDKARKLYQRYKEKIFIYNSTGSISIGISSRAGRLVNSQRLLFESCEALKKAKADPSTPIIAFKSNLEKFRAYIKNKR